MSDIYADGTYLAHNQTWHEEDSPYKARLVEKALRRTATEFGSCADVGCGSGLVAEIIARNHPQARICGYDVSPDVIGFWQARTAVTFHHADITKTTDVFDLALCLDVFEHVEDYIGFLRQLRTHARRFVFNIPLDMNIAKLITGMHTARETVGHLHYFNSYTAVATLAHAGYKVVDAYFAAGFTARPPQSVRQAIMTLPRFALMALGPKIASTIAGGYSLVVTADATS